MNEEMEYCDICKNVDTTKNWINSVLETLMKNKIIGYNQQKDSYYLQF